MPRRRWFQFHLRSFMLALLVFSVPLAWFGAERRQALYEQQVIKLLADQGVREIAFVGPYDTPFYAQEQSWWRKLARVVFGDRIRAISARRNALTDLTPLVGLSRLRAIDLSDTEVRDLSPLTSISTLDTLVLSGTRVRDFSPLAGMTNLIDLDLEDTHITDLTPLAGLTRLQRLNLANVKTTDITPLADLNNLQRLMLRRARVSDLTPLAGLTELIYLDVIDTRVTKDEIDALESLLPKCSIAPSRRKDLKKLSAAGP